MSTFWKGFAIFWIIFLVWYLSGGPQRVNNNNSPIATFDTNVAGDISTKSQYTESTSDSSSKIKSEKSFPSTLKTNTINVTN